MANSVSSKSDLEKLLMPYSRRPGIGLYKMRFEQYPTPVSIAAHMVWTASMKNRIKHLTALDLGCGNGILITASILAGASRGVCVEIDEDMLKVARNVIVNNYLDASYRVIFIEADATIIDYSSIDVVVMNPPFGVLKSNRGKDILFLLKAISNAKSVFSLHKYSEGFIRKLNNIVKNHQLEVIWFEVLNMEIPMIYSRHRRRIHRFKIVFIGLEKRFVGG
ncbi:MAG: methyltransferase [Desulfurococcaceae archaeon]